MIISVFARGISYARFFNSECGAACDEVCRSWVGKFLEHHRGAASERRTTTTRFAVGFRDRHEIQKSKTPKRKIQNPRHPNLETAGGEFWSAGGERASGCEARIGGLGGRGR